LSQHVASLEQELRRAYILGRDDWLRAVLSQQDPVEVGRQLVYSSYFARERNVLAETIRADLDVLDTTMSSLDEEKRRLAGIQASERERLDELGALRENRSVALIKINRGITTHNERLEQMRAEITQLQSLVDELTRVLVEMPVGDAEPFAGTRGRLEWPTDGRIMQRFGRPRADGRLRWDGVLLAAGAGEEVRAVHHGRVVYADWLQGMGLLVIIEHGNGYLSLYGHNQDVVAEIGEWVTPDTVIAHVGDSGGQAVPGLYFEIRKNGKPVDPAGWIHD
jgi:septal ring factor EnvC (AmiA/AmiB activator)